MIYLFLADVRFHQKGMGIGLANALQKSALAIRAENVVRGLRDVSAVSVLADGGQIIEIHITTASSRSPKQLVRDVRVALEAELGLRVDHRCISVAQKKECSEDEEVRELTLADFCEPDKGRPESALAVST